MSPKHSDVVITADSTCDLPKKYIAENDITVFPLSILLGDREYLDSVDIKPNDIYSYVEKGGDLPKTSAVTPQRYYDVFKAFADESKQVVHIGLSSGISSSYQNALTAAADLDGVYTVDSKSLCTAMGLLVLKACDLRDKGYSAKKIADKISRMVDKLSTTFIINSLEYLHKGGRCSSVAKFGANVLGIKPSITVNKETGKLEINKKYRGRPDSVYKQYVNDCLKDINKIDTDRIVIANSGQMDSATLAFIDGLIEGKNKFKTIIHADAGCTISSHCGPKTFAIFYLRK